MKERPASSNQVEAVFDNDGVQVSSSIDEFGREHPDPVPTAPPVGYVPPTDLMQMIERVIHNREFVKALQEADAESFEEADDFEVDDEDYDPRFEATIYEKYFEAKANRAAVDASQKATSRTVGAGATSGGAAPPPPSSATSEAPKPSTATPKLPSVSRLADERRETE